jgi:hypothetical protein
LLTFRSDKKKFEKGVRAVEVIMIQRFTGHLQGAESIPLECAKPTCNTLRHIGCGCVVFGGKEKKENTVIEQDIWRRGREK